jgi:hypothetical protein
MSKCSTSQLKVEFLIERLDKAFKKYVKLFMNS